MIALHYNFEEHQTYIHIPHPNNFGINAVTLISN